jgi:hypothetical protein
MESLYAYFGLLELHDIDSPGHSLYQLGLLDSISKNFGDSSFDFYSYYPDPVIKNSIRSEFPNTELGKVFNKYQKKLISNEQDISLDQVLEKIKNKQYCTLYLKARFRNLSTLSKKWKDAKEFETIINVAISSGYPSSSIIILDTDLSLSELFTDKFSSQVTILQPSIDFPGISESFLEDCVSVNVKNYHTKEKSLVFYGNIDTSSYKSSNAKDPILLEALDSLSFKKDDRLLPLTIISKSADFSKFSDNTKCIERHHRCLIWDELENSTVMLNITKEKYNSNKFIPARIYEAMIFGMIPISYKFEFLSKTFSFETLEDLEEILIYLSECDSSDLIKAYLLFVSNYIKYANSNGI